MDTSPAELPAKIAELKRELKFREAVYPRLIRDGKLVRERANRQVFVLKCILHDYTGDELGHLPVVYWTCPICQGRNHTQAGQQVTHCMRDEQRPENCGGGPFLLLQKKSNRALHPTIEYSVHKVEGIDYPAVQGGLL